MTPDARLELSGFWWNRRFTDSSIERGFVQEFNRSGLVIARAAMAIALVVWVGFLLFDLALESPQKQQALTFRFSLVMIFSFLLGLHFVPSVARIYQPLILFVVGILQGGIIYVVTLYDFEIIAKAFDVTLGMTNHDAQYVFVVVWLLVVFLSTSILRLLTHACTIAGMMTLGFAGLSMYLFGPSALFLSVSIPFLIAAVLVVFIGSVDIQNYARENMRARRLLEKSRMETESLLLNVLPRPIADRLKSGERTLADGFSEVSVLFADITDFTALSERLSPGELIQLLSGVFSEFDKITSQRGVEKIKTIGDAYMAAAGVPVPRKDHCRAIAESALEMNACMEKFVSLNAKGLRLRVGIHTGPAIAGVIGQHKFAYDVWGDTVNVASRMESHGLAERIHATEEIYEKLKDDYVFEPRGETDIKGKGRLRTWWLIGRKEGVR